MACNSHDTAMRGDREQRPAATSPSEPGAGRDIDRLLAKIACLPTGGIPLTLVSTAGFHCEVWQSIGVLVSGPHRTEIDFVLKRYLRPSSLAATRVLGREHETLRQALGDIVPATRFVATRVNGKVGVVALCETCPPWFDLGNPANEEEALPLLARHRRARDDLVRFVAHARRWLDEEGKVIDLCGTENLVLDRAYRVRYIDSFHVFFYLDVLHTLQEVDEELRYRLDLAVRRLRYLEALSQRA